MKILFLLLFLILIALILKYITNVNEHIDEKNIKIIDGSSDILPIWKSMIHLDYHI